MVYKYRITLATTCYTLELEADRHTEDYDYFRFYLGDRVVAKLISVAVRELKKRAVYDWIVCPQDVKPR